MKWVQVIVGAFLLLCTHLSADTPDFYIFTYTNIPHIGVDYFADSAADKGVDVNILGIGSADYDGPPVGDYKGLISRVEQYYQALTDFNIKDDDIVMFTDSHDVIFLKSKEVILDRFLKTGVPLLVGAERGNEPLRHIGRLYPPSPTTFRFLNAGGYIGYAKYVKEVLEWILYKPETRGNNNSDQASFIIYYLTHKDTAYLDYFNQVFFNSHKVNKDELLIDAENRKITFKGTGVEPCVLHGSGSNPLYMEIRKMFYGEKPERGYTVTRG